MSGRTPYIAAIWKAGVEVGRPTLMSWRRWPRRSMRWARNGIARWARARSRTEPDSPSIWTIRRRRPLRTGGGPRRNRRMTRSTRCCSVSTRSSMVIVFIVTGGARTASTAPRPPVYYPSAMEMSPIVTRVRAFVDAEVRPVAAELEHADRYPHALVIRMRELGLFGALVPVAYGGLGLDVTTYARVIEELCRGWMSLAGVLNSHTMAALIVLQHGSDEQAIRTTARRRGEEYVVNGTKMFVTNGREGNAFALLAVTDAAAAPRHRGMSCFIVEKGHPGLRVAQSIGKLGYKGVDTAELVFEDFVVPAGNLVGGVAGRGFKHVMSGLEAGRINIAAR